MTVLWSHTMSCIAAPPAASKRRRRRLMCHAKHVGCNHAVAPALQLTWIAERTLYTLNQICINNSNVQKYLTPSRIDCVTLIRILTVQTNIKCIKYWTLINSFLVRRRDLLLASFHHSAVFTQATALEWCRALVTLPIPEFRLKTTLHVSRMIAGLMRTDVDFCEPICRVGLYFVGAVWSRNLDNFEPKTFVLQCFFHRTAEQMGCAPVTVKTAVKHRAKTSET